jgi:hypothetical protein
LIRTCGQAISEMHIESHPRASEWPCSAVKPSFEAKAFRKRIPAADHRKQIKDRGPHSGEENEEEWRMIEHPINPNWWWGLHLAMPS